MVGWLWLVQPALAETWVVCAEVVPPMTDCDFTSLSQALLLTAQDDTLELTAGDHRGSLLFLGDGRRLRGEGPATRIVARWDLVGVPVVEVLGAGVRLEDLEIDGAGIAPGVVVQQPGSASLDGVTVRGGDVGVVGYAGGLAGGLTLIGAASAELDGVHLLDNAGYAGGAIGLLGAATLWMEGGSIAGNTAWTGGGLSVDGPGFASLTGVALEENHADDRGGHVYVREGVVELSGAKLAEGTVFGEGSAAWAGEFASLTLTGSEVSGGGRTTADGAVESWALHAASGAWLEVAQSAVVGGQAGAIGGSLASAVVVRQSTIDGTQGIWGGGIAAFQTGSLVVEDSWVCGATAERGAGIDLWESCAPGPCLVSRSVVQGVSASEFGGAVKVYDPAGPVTLEHLTLVGNAAPEGPGAYLTGGVGVTLTRSLLVDHQGGPALFVGAGPPTVEWNAFGGNAGGDATIPLSGTNRVGVAPVFVGDAAPCGTDVRLADVPENGWLLDHDVGAFPGDCGSCVDGDGDGWPAYDDCDDADPDRWPGAAELPADGVDQDCDGLERCRRDDDGDGFGTLEEVESPALDCVAEGVSPTDDDCGPLDPSIHPGADDPPGDGVDANCDGLDGLDGDGDGLEAEVDCDDGDPAVAVCLTAVVGGGGCGCAGGGGAGGGVGVLVAWLAARRRAQAQQRARTTRSITETASTSSSIGTCSSA